jgi:nucleoside phosphorylase
MKTLIVTPTAREAGALGELARAFVCGTGESAYRALADRLRTGAPQMVVLAGFCGGLDPSLEAGSVILGRQVAMAGQPTLDPDRFLIEDVRKSLHANGLPFVFAKLLTADAPVATRDEKRDLWNEHGAAGVDMETYQAVRACAEARIKWVVVRVVIDTAAQELPAGLRSWANESDEAAIGRRAARNPLEWPGYLRLGLRYPRVKGALKRATVRVVRAAQHARNVETLDLLEVAPK